MEMRVADRVLNYEQEMKEADAYGNIRLLHIDNTTSPVPLDEASVRHGGWQVCSGENIADFSATGYFFGKELYKNLGIPIGLIEVVLGRDVRRVVDERRSAVRDALFPSPRREGEADPRISGGA